MDVGLEQFVNRKVSEAVLRCIRFGVRRPGGLNKPRRVNIFFGSPAL